MPSQPTILVKKSDGTSVRMTMEEFKAFKNQITNPKLQVPNKSQIQNPKPEPKEIEAETKMKIENLPMKEPVRQMPATTAPVTKIFEDEARGVNKTQNAPAHNASQSDAGGNNTTQITNSKLQAPNGKLQVTSYKLQDKKTETRFNGRQAKNWEQADNKPLLQEDVVGARKQDVIRTTLPDSRGDAFDAVIRNLKFPVRDELRPRLKSLIVSRVKDIRTDEQVGEYAIRPVENGGLGLNEGQVVELLQLVNMKTLKHESIKTQMADSRKQITDNQNRTPNTDNRMPSYKLQDTSYKKQAGGAKPILHDVVAPVEPAIEPKVGMGPMEEFASFQMIDFRRLGGAVQAGEVMRKKFETMRSESLILYLRAIKAWRESPIYQQYQKVLVNAINRGRSVKEAVEEIGWKWEEFEAINKLCSNL